MSLFSSSKIAELTEQLATANSTLETTQASLQTALAEVAQLKADSATAQAAKDADDKAPEGDAKKAKKKAKAEGEDDDEEEDAASKKQSAEIEQLKQLVTTLQATQSEQVTKILAGLGIVPVSHAGDLPGDSKQNADDPRHKTLSAWSK